MGSPGPLCEYCAKVPLKSPDVGDEHQSGWTLGSGTRIAASSCPLCRLVTKAFQTLCQTAEGSTEELELSTRPAVNLHWYSASGPGGRGAFTTDPARLQIWLCKANNASGRARDIRTHYMNPRIGPEFDAGRLSNWISTCTRAHSDLCNAKPTTLEQSFPGLNVLRFIDVEQGCIVELCTLPIYVALSYVWGNVASLRLTTVNRGSLLSTGAIYRAWQRIPNTITDAIELVRRLRIRYLWVDALCLVQNDQNDTANGVAVMDKIYEESWLTIIAAYGHNANAGLPGVREGSRSEEIVTKITDDISLGLHVPLERLLKRSMYTSRAWTFQEQLLARRAVYFFQKQVYFRCKENACAEQLSDDYRGENWSVLDDDTWSSLLPYASAMDEPLRDYAIMLLYYTRRALTNDFDILRAMAGIIRRVSERTRCRFLEGMPTVAFDVFVVFRTRSSISRKASDSLSRRGSFPSYSWSGWKGGIVVDDSPFESMNDWLEKDTWIVWYKRSPSGVLSLVWDPAANETFPVADLSYPGYRRRTLFQAPDQLHISSSRTRPSEDLLLGVNLRGYYLLQFWTLSVHFRLETEDVFAGTASILTTRATWAGTIYLDGLEENDFFNSQDRFEFILLSGADEFSYNTLLLEWQGTIAERRGLGYVDKSAIIDSFSPGPQWKEIILG